MNLKVNIVITLLMAAIRSEKDLSKGRLREIDISNDITYILMMLG